MDPERQVNINRYLRFVIAFLLIMFGALGVYEYYYGNEARKAQELQQQVNQTGYPGTSIVVTTTIP
jgi:hypothetical protein